MAVVAVEGDAVVGEVADGGGALADDRAHRRLLAQTGAGIERVGHVAFHRVAGIALVFLQHRGDAALRPGGVGVVGVALGEHDHRAVAGRAQCEGQTGDAGTDDQEIRCHAREAWTLIERRERQIRPFRGLTGRARESMTRP